MISGFESRAQVFPPYEDNSVFRSANINDRKHLSSKSKLIQNVVWEANLRMTPEEQKILLARGARLKGRTKEL